MLLASLYCNLVSADDQGLALFWMNLENNSSGVARHSVSYLSCLIIRIAKDATAAIEISLSARTDRCCYRLEFLEPGGLTNPA